MAHALKKIEMMYSDVSAGLVGFDEYATARDAIAGGTSDILDGFINK